MTIVPKLILRVNVIPIKNPVLFKIFLQKR